MPDRLRVGIVGTGEVAQIIHLPTLRHLGDRYTVTALCDVSPKVLQEVGDRWGVPTRVQDHRELVQRPDVDIVLVANPHLFHAEVALAAMAAGKHVLVEKPVCLSLADLDRLEEAEARTGVVVQVGFMRRYAPAFMEAKKRLGELGPVRLARVHDVIGQNALIIRNVADVIRPDDLPKSAAAELKTRTDAAIAAVIGTDRPALVRAYGMLLGLSSHDISAMRELLGTPKHVIYAAQRCEDESARYLSAAFDYGDFVCHFETGVDRIPRFDAHIEIFGSSQVLRVDWDTPYVRNLPSRLHVTAATPGDGVATTTAQPSWQDAFLLEWQAFAENIRDRRRPKTSLADARADLQLFAQMMASMQ